MIRLCLALVLAAPLAAQTQPNTSPTRFARWAYQDLGALGRQIVTPEFGLAAAGAAGGTVALAWLDDDVVFEANRAYSGTYADVLEALDDAGGPNMTLYTLGLAAGSFVVPDTRFQDAAMTALQTLVYAGLTGYALKGIVGRARPEDVDNPFAADGPGDLASPYAFFETTGKNPFSSEGNSAWPSGHSISSFGIVTVWATYYPHPLTYALYLLPAGAVINRMSVYKHWPTDIFVGAAIGIATGRFLALRHQRLQNGETASTDSRFDFRVGLGTAALTYRIGD